MTGIGGGIAQFCYGVEDLDEAMQGWTKSAGAGPFFVQKHLGEIPVRYRGEASSIDVSVAFGQAAGVQIERLWAIKRMVKAMLGFKAFWSAAITIADGIEIMHMIHKGQLRSTGKLRPAQQFYSLAG
jgi:hypothetical protein